MPMRAGLELRHLRTFVAVVDAGGFVRAARTLGVAQSTVSESLAALERALGAEVLARRGRGHALTPAGEALLPHARALLRAAGEAEVAVAAAVDSARITVVVRAPESVGAVLLPPAIAAVRARWPGSRFRVESALCEEVRAAVREERVDLGLVLEPAAPVEGEDRGVAEVPLVVFAAPDHPLAGRTAPAFELWRRRFVFGEAAGHYHALLRAFFEAAGYGTPAMEVVGSVDAVRRTVLADRASLGALPAFVVAEDVARGRAAVVGTSPPLGRLHLKAVDPPRGTRSPVAAALVDALAAAGGEAERAAG
jgi:DNA-binding transcriptional LysR family regulator